MFHVVYDNGILAKFSSEYFISLMLQALLSKGLLSKDSILRRLDMIFCHLLLGRHFCYFMFAFLHTKALSEKAYTLKFFPFRVIPFRKGSKTICQGFNVLMLVTQHCLPNFSNRGIGIINFGKFFLSFIVDTTNWLLNTITKTRLFKYVENFTKKNEKFQIKALIFFISLLKT